MKWSTVFAEAMSREMTIKPWCHLTHLIKFDKEVAANPLMKEWDY